MFKVAIMGAGSIANKMAITLSHIVIRDFIPHQKKDYPSHYQKVRCSLI